MRRFTDTKVRQRDCCGELGLKFNIGQLCVDVKLKGTASYFDDIKHASIKVSYFEGKLKSENRKTTRQSNTARHLQQYIYFMFFDVFSTVHHRIELFHLPTLMHNSLFINNMYVTLPSSTCSEH